MRAVGGPDRSGRRDARGRRRWRRPRRRGARGVSDIIATIITLSLCVILAAVVLAYVILNGQTSVVPSEVFSVQLAVGSVSGGQGITEVSIDHVQGAVISGATTGQASVRLTSQAVPTAFGTPFTLAAGLSGSTMWPAGVDWTLNVTSYALPVYDNLTVVISSGTIVIFVALAPGTAAFAPPYFTSASISPDPAAPGSSETISATVEAPNGLTVGTAPAGVTANVTGIITTYQELAKVSVGTGPKAVAYDSANGYLYVACTSANDVSVVNGATNAVVGSSIGVGNSPEGIAFDSTNGYLYVANHGANTVTVINGATDAVVGSAITVGSGPIAVAFDATNGYVYVVNNGANTVTVINGATDAVVGSAITVGSGPDAVAFDATNGYVYVVNNGANTVTVINGATDAVVGSAITVGSGPMGIGFDVTNGYLYVANHGASTVSVINGATDAVVGSAISVGSGPEAAIYVTPSGDVFVANDNANTVTIFNASTDATVGTAVATGSNGPLSEAYDSANGGVYVVCSTGNSLVEVGPSPSGTIDSMSYSTTTGVWTLTLSSGPTKAGSYAIVLTATDNFGLSTSVAVTLTVT